MKTALFWGLPTLLFVDGQVVQARRMQAMDTDLSNSNTCRKLLRLACKRIPEVP